MQTRLDMVRVFAMQPWKKKKRYTEGFVDIFGIFGQYPSR
jgi:hypothetical protein